MTSLRNNGEYNHHYRYLFVNGQDLSISYHSAALVKDKLYFLGGVSSNGTFLNQIIYLDLSSPFTLNNSPPVKLLSPIPLNQPPPFKGAGTAVASVDAGVGGVSINTNSNNKTIYIVGGQRNATFKSTKFGALAYSLDTGDPTSWQPLTISGLDQIANDSEALSYITDVQDNQGKVYIYGVIDLTKSTKNLYILDLIDLTLSFGARVGAPPMNGRYSCVLLNNMNILYFGGFNGSGEYENRMTTIYMYNIRSNLWSTMDTTGDQPTNRYSSSSVVDSNGHVIVYGGTLGTTPILVTDKLAILDTNQIPYKWTVPSNVNYPFNGEHCFHTATLVGTQMIVAFGTGRSADGKNVPVQNIYILDITDLTNLKWVDKFSPASPTLVTSTTTASNHLSSNNSNNPPSGSSNKKLVTILILILGIMGSIFAVGCGVYIRKSCIDRGNNLADGKDSNVVILSGKANAKENDTNVEVSNG